MLKNIIQWAMGDRSGTVTPAENVQAGEAAAISNQTTLVQSSDPQIVSILGGPQATSGYAVNEQSAMRVSVVYACVRLIAGAIAGLPLQTYQNTDKGREALVSPFWYLLNEQPSARWTAASMWEWVLKCIMLRGDGFVQIMRKGAKVVGLNPLHPDRVNVRLVDGRLRYDVFPFEGDPYGLDQDDILHFAGFGFDGWRSMSILQWAAFQSVGIALAADGFSGAYFKNGGTPKHLIMAPTKVSDDQIALLRTTYAEKYTGVENAGKPMVLTEGLTIKELSMTSADVELLESRKYQVIDISRAFGVPPHMVGANETTSSWGSGVEQLTLAFIKFTLQPYLTRIVQEVNRKLYRDSEVYFVEHDLGALLKGDAKSEGEYLRQCIGGSQGPGWMTTNEVRRLKNLPPVADGDTLYVPKGNTNAQTPPPAAA